MKKNEFFFNGCFDKNRIKSLISWSLQNCGEQSTIELVESLKNIGFNYATQAGVSLGIDDLKIPPTKAQLISDSDIKISTAQIQYKQGNITGIEKFQQLIDTWHRTSDILKQNVIQYFRVTNVLNPVYMMAFSGARGNISQVRQLVGMRGLMSDPQGQILDFPIKSNFREGLTLTEYIISCYGARKGLVDTALKTANSGYLTRRLVDVSHHIIVCEFDCKTKKGIILNTIIENQKIIFPLQNRLVGRILAENIYLNFSAKAKPSIQVNYLSNLSGGFNKSSFNLIATSLKNKADFARQVALFSELLMSHFFSAPQNWVQNQVYEIEDLPLNQIEINKKKNYYTKSQFNKNFPLYQLLLFLKHVNIYCTKQQLIAVKNQEISLSLAIKIASFKKQVLVRSPLTCEIKNSICQLCYGWSLAHGKLVSLGEAVGILAAQSIGEPGTQLTMRTFHTGGVFSGDIMSEIRAPFDGIVQFSEFFQGMLIRTPHGKIAFLTKIPGKFEFFPKYQSNFTLNEKFEKINFQIPAFTILFVRNHEYVSKTQIIAEFSSVSADREQRIQANYSLNTEIEGEVFFKNVIVHARKKKKKLISRTTANLGSIWVVSGKIYTQPIPIAMFPKSGDLVDQISVIGQYKTISPYNGFLTTLSNNSSLLSTNTNALFFNYEALKFEGLKPSIQVDPSLCLAKQGNEPSLQLALPLAYIPTKLKHKQSAEVKTPTLSKDNSKKIKLKNNTVLLNHPLILFPIQSIQYKKIGYFFSFCQPQKPQFRLDQFFLSNSLQQEFYNSNKLQTTFYFQNFPKKYQTQIGGILVYDNFYLNEKLHSGEVFWIDEESYMFNFDNTIYFKNKYDKDTKITNSTLFSFKQKLSLKKPPIHLVKSKLGLKENIEYWNSVQIGRRKNFIKWVSRTNPLIFQYNNQGKNSNIYSTLSGFLETSIIDIFGSNGSFATTSTLFTYKQDNNQNTSLGKLGINHQNDWKQFFYMDDYKFEIIGVKINPIIFIFKLFGLNLCSTKKNLNTYKFFFKSNIFYSYRLQYFKENKAINTSLLQKNSLPFLQPKFPWDKSYKYNLFESSLTASFSNQIKPSISNLLTPLKDKQANGKNTFSISNSSTLSSVANLSTSLKDKQRKGQNTKQSKNKYKSIVKFYNLSKKKIKQKNKALNKANFTLVKNKLGALNKKKGLIKIRIKSGWIYFPKNIKQVIQNHKSIIKPGEKWCDDILFDQYGVYIEFLSLKKTFVGNNKHMKIASFMSQRSFDANEIKKKNSDLSTILNVVQIYTDFNLELNSKTLNLFSNTEASRQLNSPFFLRSKRVEAKLKQKMNFLNSTPNYKFSISFLKVLDTLFKNIDNALFCNKNFSISSPLFSPAIQNTRSSISYKLFLLEKCLHKNKFESFYLLHKEFKQNSKIEDQPLIEIDFLVNLLKVYNYKKIYFLENSISLKNVRQINNFVLLHTNVRKKNFFSLQDKSLTQVDLSINLSREQYWNKKSVSHTLFFRSKNIFIPQSFLLIRKIKSYPFIPSIYYKRLLAQQNKLTLYSYVNQNILSSEITNWTQLLSFNKQNSTQLFHNILPADFCVKPYFKYKDCKKNIFFKNNTILEFYILFIIPPSYSANTAKIQLIPKSVVNNLNLKIIKFFSLFCNAKKNFNRGTTLQTSFRSKLITPFANISTSLKYKQSKGQSYRSNFLIKQRNKLNFACIIYLNVSTFRKFQFSNHGLEFSANKNIQLTRTKLLAYSQNFISNHTPVSLTKFFSPYQGEILKTELHTTKKKKYLILTNSDQKSFSIPSLFNDEISLPKNFLGKFIHYGTQIQSNCVIPESGLIIQIEKSKITVRKAQSILFSSKGLLSVYHGDLVEKNALILRLFYQRLKTGDIVQGIPKIEQLFEARKTNQGELLIGSLHEELEWLFLFYKKKYDFQKAARKSLEKIQQIVVTNVHKVYQSQGVTIAEKHLEIIVRQMTSKVQIITSGQTNLIPGELVDLDWIEIVNKGIKLKKKKAKYKPIILGITKKSLETKSFISEASFQETTRILAKSAIERKTDFLRGLKENVILGHLIPAGTGFAGKVFDSNKPKYFATNNYESYTIFRKIFLETTC